MNNRKNITILIVIIFILLLLAFGYMAVIKRPIFISGSANANKTNGDFSVVFDKEYEPIKSSKAIKIAKVDNTNVALISVDLDNTKDKEMVTFFVKNISSKLRAKTMVKVVEQDEIIDEYFEIIPTLDNEIIDSGGNSKVTIEIKLKKEPQRDITGNFKIMIDSHPE